MCDYLHLLLSKSNAVRHVQPMGAETHSCVFSSSQNHRFPPTLRKTDDEPDRIVCMESQNHEQRLFLSTGKNKELFFKKRKKKSHRSFSGRVDASVSIDPATLCRNTRL